MNFITHTAPRGMAWLLLFTLFGCSSFKTEMVMTSNIDDTKFMYRERSGIERDMNEGWVDIGSGQKIASKFSSYTGYEIAAVAPGYRMKVIPLIEPVPRCDFHFMTSERLETTASPGPAIAKPSAPRASSQPPVSVSPAKEPALPAFTGVRHALIVGISNYKSNAYADLNNAARDAAAIKQFLSSAGGGNLSNDHIKLLTDAEATRANIIKTLTLMGAEANPGDLIMVYYAGHARADGGDSGQRYLIPWDGEPDNPKGSCLDRNNFAKLLDEAQQRRQLLFMDCCFAGGPAVRANVKDTWANVPIGRSAPPGMGTSLAASRVVITSTAGDETALDSTNGAKNSPFATALIEILRDRKTYDIDQDQTLSASEVYAALAPKVRGAAARAGGTMSPQFYLSGRKEIISVVKTAR